MSFLSIFNPHSTEQKIKDPPFNIKIYTEMSYTTALRLLFLEGLTFTRLALGWHVGTCT